MLSICIEMYVSEEQSRRVYIVLSVILYMNYLTISALCGSYHDVLVSLLLSVFFSLLCF